ncbi:MAG: hypothetical protein ABJB16_05865 [Saprospiraceae bacterium]
MVQGRVMLTYKILRPSMSNNEISTGSEELLFSLIKSLNGFGKITTSETFGLLSVFDVVSAKTSLQLVFESIELLTVRHTLNTPVCSYLCDTLLSKPNVPSPKSHLQFVGA